MTLAPDHTGYHVNGESNDAEYVDLVSLHTDATHPVIEALTLKEAEHAVLYHIQQFHSGEVETVKMAFHCACVDLGREVPEDGFTELAHEYAEPMTPDEADTWAQQLTAYLADQDGWATR